MGSALCPRCIITLSGGATALYVTDTYEQVMRLVGGARGRADGDPVRLLAAPLVEVTGFTPNGPAPVAFAAGAVVAVHGLLLPEPDGSGVPDAVPDWMTGDDQ